jgi:hypothetical protein
LAQNKCRVLILRAAQLPYNKQKMLKSKKAIKNCSH